MLIKLKRTLSQNSAALVYGALSACGVAADNGSTTSGMVGGGAAVAVASAGTAAPIVAVSKPIAPSASNATTRPVASATPSATPAAGSGGAPAATGVASSASGAPAAAPSGVAPTTPGAPAAGAPRAPGMRPWNTNGKTCLKAGSGQFGEPGPYQVGMLDVDLGMVQSNQTTGKFTIFYPNPLEGECAHPIVAWGNGTGVNDSTTYAFFNQNAASWGMVVIASQDPNTGSGAFHKAGLDYMLKQNEDPMSMFYKKLSTRAGTSGHSQGAFGSVAGAAHPNVSVNVGVGGSASGAAQHASLCLTGTEDIAADTCPAAVDNAQGPFFTASWNKGDHFTTQTLAGYITRDAGSLATQRLYSAWFRCFLADDSVACNLFKGPTPSDCGLCKEGMDWAVLKSKNVE